MKHSWLREAVDRVLAEAPHMSDEHKRKLVEAVGLELARACAQGRLESATSLVEFIEEQRAEDEKKRELFREAGLVRKKCPRCNTDIYIDIASDLERERARVRFELRGSIQPNRGRDG
jgi:hypothetical protein